MSSLGFLPGSRFAATHWNIGPTRGLVMLPVLLGSLFLLIPKWRIHQGLVIREYESMWRFPAPENPDGEVQREDLIVLESKERVLAPVIPCFSFQIDAPRTLSISGVKGKFVAKMASKEIYEQREKDGHRIKSLLPWNEALLTQQPWRQISNVAGPVCVDWFRIGLALCLGLPKDNLLAFSRLLAEVGGDACFKGR
ncbi:hypothetical protein Nepgr_017051 [Nepenthes gracilis]|uniref:Uncharacterized protein n=1 Tax=Nepenthes gracilis TaxID=150966 RepID=A0AAD3XT18_NEPGR|nr:hypothetical protein Nepgr_017051 [Nepenthes gracilis]